MYKTLGFRWIFEVFCPATVFASADSDEACNPQRFIHVTVTGKEKKEKNDTLYRKPYDSQLFSF